MGRTVALFVAVVLCAGCHRPDLPTQPTPPTPPFGAPVATPLAISRVAPTAGWPFYDTEVLGSGFKPGARVTFGGLEAQDFGSVSTGKILTNPPWRDSGPVDVVVTNPDGSSVTLAGGFTYRAATLELSKDDVGPGETLRVTWSGPHDPSDFSPPDIIGLYAVDDPHNTALWLTTSGVGDRFSREFQAPTNPGAYEVRYHTSRRQTARETRRASPASCRRRPSDQRVRHSGHCLRRVPVAPAEPRARSQRAID